MKNFKWACVPSFLILGLLASAGCSSNNSPTQPNNTPTLTPTITSGSTATSTATATSTRTPTGTPTPVTGITWGGVNVSGSNYNGNGYIVYMQLNGQPDTSALVVLSGPALTVPVTASYGGPAPDGAVTLSYYSESPFTYQAGAPYTVTIAAGGVTSTAPVTGIGGVFGTAPDGSAMSWTVNGNSYSLEVIQVGSNSVVYSNFGNGLSPASIPVSAYATPGAYNLSLSLYDNSNKQSGGTYLPYQPIGSSYYYSVTIVSSPTVTPSPTITPTITPTGTPTSTPTITSTSTLTSTPTATATTGTSCQNVGTTSPLTSRGATAWYWIQYQAPASATQLTALSMYLYADTGTTNHFEMAFYTDNSSASVTAIGNLISGTDTGEQSFNGAGTSGWQTVTIAPIPITGGANYWIGAMTDGDTGFTFGGSQPFALLSGATFNNPPADGTGAFNVSDNISVYATFCQ